MPKRSVKFYFKNEKSVMKSLGLKPTKGSGNGWIEKEDGQNEEIIAQLKTTDKNSFSLKKSDLEVLEYNAAVCCKTPAFIIQFLEEEDGEGGGNLYLVCKILDLPALAQYINSGYCYSGPPEGVELDLSTNSSLESEKIPTGDRRSFWEEMEKRYAKKR